jgi:16S rRNA U516 pseudouridylate synthase RsuA-like enzyme
MRLNMYLQQAGVGSRREAERLIAAGQVTINGKPATATMAVNTTDRVQVDGRTVNRWG